MPRVSILMSSYNHEAFVAGAVRSVLEQDYADWELILRDDGSTDRTPEVIDEFKDPRIRYLGTGERVGGAASLNRCLRHAAGELVAIMNSDDEWLPRHLATQISVLDRGPEIAATFSHAEIVDERGDTFRGDDLDHGRIFIQPNRSRQGWLRFFFQKGNCLCHPSAVIRRRVFEETGPYDALMQRLPDFDLWVRLCARHEVHVHQAPLLRFRLMDDESNASADSPRKRELRAYEHTKVLARFASEPILGQLHEIFPEWIAPGDTEEQRLLGLARAALAVSSSPHHFFALDCLREQMQRTKKATSTTESGDERLLDLTLSARPLSLFSESSTRWRIFCRREGETDFSGDHGVISRPLVSGAIGTDTVELPAGTVQLRLEFDGAYQSLEIFSMTLLNSEGREVWSLLNAQKDALQITGAQLLESSADGLKLARMEGKTQLLLPETPVQSGLRLRCSLRIQHDLRSIVRECEMHAKKLKAAEKQQAQAQKTIASAVAWEKQSWLKRVFRRWQPPLE